SRRARIFRALVDRFHELERSYQDAMESLRISEGRFRTAFSQEALQWFDYAQGDIKAASLLSRDSQTFRESLYHSQQASEKALKGLLIFLMHDNHGNRISEEAVQKAVRRLSHNVENIRQAVSKELWGN